MRHEQRHIGVRDFMGDAELCDLELQADDFFRREERVPASFFR